MNESSTAQTWQFTITRDDYYQAIMHISQNIIRNRHVLGLKPTWNQWANIFLMIFMIAIFLISGELLRPEKYGNAKWITLALTVTIIFCCLLMGRISHGIYKYCARDNGFCLGQFQIQIDSDYMLVKNHINESMSRLEALFLVEEIEHMILVYYEPHMALPIPKRDIGDEAACRKLIQALTPGK